MDGEGLLGVVQDEPPAAPPAGNNVFSTAAGNRGGGEGLTFSGGNSSSNSGGGEGSPKHGSLMIRSGKLPPTQSLFDLEVSAVIHLIFLSLTLCHRSLALMRRL